MAGEMLAAKEMAHAKVPKNKLNIWETKRRQMHLECGE